MEENAIRISNGYRMLYTPSHPKAIKAGCWKGFVYEHTLVAEKMLKRPLRVNEVVHHLDGSRSNNRSYNLLVLERSQHLKLHAFLKYKCAISNESVYGIRENSVKATVNQCLWCGKTLQGGQKRFCCQEHASLTQQKKSKCPSKEELIATSLFLKGNMLAIGRHYKVSDNAVRKWFKRYKITKLIPSRAGSALPEGVETSGEV